MLKKLLYPFIKTFYVYPLISIFYLLLNFLPGENAHILNTSIDNSIPFIEAAIIPYFYWYVYMGFALVYLAILNFDYYFSMLKCIVYGTLVSGIIFFLFHTTFSRPAIIETNFLSILVQFLYSIDRPYNCLPSIHVLDSLFATLFICKYTHGALLKSYAAISFSLISLSTLLVKQHSVLDFIASVFLGLIIFAAISLVSENRSKLRVLQGQ